MGYDERHQSSSSGAIVAIVVAVLLVALFGVLAVAGAGFLLVGTTSSMQSQPAIDIRLVDDDEVVGELQQSGVAAAPDSRLNFELNLDREGNASVDGEKIDLGELRARLAKLKDETSNAFSVRINADPECPAKHVVSVLDVCEEVGDVDYRVVSSKDSDVPADESDAGN